MRMTFSGHDSDSAFGAGTSQNNLHWMPFHVGDYLRETRHMTAIERDGYVNLQCEYWTKGHLPVDDTQLARIAGMTLKSWRKSLPAIQQCFAPGWKHPRLDGELARVKQLSEKNTERARNAANKRWSGKASK